MNNNSVFFFKGQMIYSTPMLYPLSLLPQWISALFTAFMFNLQYSVAIIRLWREGEGHRRGHGHLITLVCPSADGVNPLPVLTTAITAALHGLAENWVSGIYLSGLSSGPKIVQVISLILAILLQLYCPSTPCKHGHKLFGPHTFFVLWLGFFPSHCSKHELLMTGNAPSCCFTVWKAVQYTPLFFPLLCNLLFVNWENIINL